MYTYKYILEKHSVCVWEVNVHVQSYVHYHFVFTTSFVLQYDWTACFIIILCLLWNVIFHFFCCVLARYHFYQIFSVFYAQWFFQAKVTWMFTMIYPESFSHKQSQIICVAQLCSNAFQFLLLYLVVDGWRLNCVFLGISNPKFLKCALTLLDAHFPFCLAKCGCFQFYFFFAFRVWHSKRMRWWKRNLPARQGFKHVSAFLVPFLKYALTM